MRLIKHSLRNLGQKGAAGVEFAIIVPLFIILTLIIVESHQYFRVINIVDRTASNIANSIALQPYIDNQTDCTQATNLCAYKQPFNALMLPEGPFTEERLQLDVSVYEIDDEAWVPAWEMHCNPGNSSPCTAPSGISNLPLSALDNIAKKGVMIQVGIIYKYKPKITRFIKLGDERELQQKVVVRAKYPSIAQAAWLE